MRHLVIGIDADGVLTDMSKFNIECGTKFFKKNPVNPELSLKLSIIFYISYSNIYY